MRTFIVFVTTAILSQVFPVMEVDKGVAIFIVLGMVTSMIQDLLEVIRER